MKTIGEAVSKRIDELLYKRGMSLYGLSKKTGLPLSTLKNLYTKHTKSPTLSLLFKICDGLNITIEEFFDTPIFDREKLDALLYE